MANKKRVSQLDRAYAVCKCGAKLNKRNRFAVKLEAPQHINTTKGSLKIRKTGNIVLKP